MFCQCVTTPAATTPVCHGPHAPFWMGKSPKCVVRASGDHFLGRCHCSRNFANSGTGLRCFLPAFLSRAVCFALYTLFCSHGRLVCVDRGQRLDPFPDKEKGIWIAVFDLLQHVAKKKAERKVFERISEQHPEVVTYCHDFQFSGRGQRSTPSIPLRKVVSLLQVTPGEAGNAVRTESAELLCRYIGGDTAIADEVHANAAEQQRLAAEDPTNPARLFGMDVEDHQRDLTALERDAKLARIQQQKRQIELETEDMEYRAKIRREEAERQATQRREEDQIRREELTKQHASKMYELSV